MNVVAGIAVTLKKAATSDFQVYARQVLRNAKVLAGALMERGMKLVTDGTDNHMMVVDTVASVGLDGRAAEDVLDAIAVTTNKQVIPDDPRPPLRPSGIRLGTPAATTRGMGESEMRRIGEFIAAALQANGDDVGAEHTIDEVRNKVDQALGRADVAPEVLMLLAAVRGGINGLMAEVLEDHIRLHLLQDDRASLTPDLAEDLIDLVRAYLK